MPPKAKARKKAPQKTDAAIAPTNSNSGSDEWHTETTVLSTSAPFLQVAKFDDTTSRFTQTVHVQRSDAFRLESVTLTEGPLKGRQVLLMQPLRDLFRFLDLPAEIRTMIYEELMKEGEPIRMKTIKPKGERRRPVGNNFESTVKHRGLLWHKETGKWIGKAPTAYALMGVNKQIQQEAASVAYGSNEFRFPHLSDMRAFLDSIGSMRKFLRSVKITDPGFQNTVATTVFHLLKQATDLRSISLQHSAICRRANGGDGTTAHGLFMTIKPLMAKLQKYQKTQSNPVNVLDIVHIEEWRPKALCASAETCACYGRCAMKCRDQEKHNQDTRSEFRNLLAAALGLEA